MSKNIPNITYRIFDIRKKGADVRTELMNFISELESSEGFELLCEEENTHVSFFMEQREYSKYVDRKSDNDFSIFYYPTVFTKELQMMEYLNLDKDKLDKIMDIKLDVFRGAITMQEAKDLVKASFDSVSAEEFAYGEQHLLTFGITDEIIADGMDDILDVFDSVLERGDLDLPFGHPIHTYDLECTALENLVGAMKIKIESTFIKNEWLVLYDKLDQINTHFSRKQNQLFSALEKKGFDRPSKVMWTFDNKVRDLIKEARLLLENDKDDAFIAIQPEVFHLVLDILSKEKDVLYPTSLKLLSEQEFADMRISDDEIGYCLIPEPAKYGKSSLKASATADNTELLKDLSQLLAKHGLAHDSQDDEVFDVSMGKMTLKQINLIFKHLQVDLSYVDENEIVKFYSDTVHRVFPRSAGVIGREVQNCHPRESVATVERIIEAFRTGEKSEAEFWIQMGGKFIYIIYNAVRDEDGTFRGVLEMMQDVTHIRSLEGNQKLLSWDDDEKVEKPIKEKLVAKANKYGLTGNTILSEVFKKYPYLKVFLFELSPKYVNLKNPVVFNVMKTVATLEMVSGRGGFKLDEFIAKLEEEIDKH